LQCFAKYAIKKIKKLFHTNPAHLAEASQPERFLLKKKPGRKRQQKLQQKQQQKSFWPWNKIRI
jgi:hypothetical protein